MNDKDYPPETEENGVELNVDDEEQQDRLYVGAKIITGCPMDELTFIGQHKGHIVGYRENRAGYRVTYPDGYISWSPKAVFETAYREITSGELALMK